MAKINKKVWKKNKNIPHLTIGIAAVVIAILLTLTVTDRMSSSRNGDVSSVSLVEPDDTDVTTDTEENPIDLVDDKETGTTDETTETGTSGGTEDEETSDATADQTDEEELIADTKICTSSDSDGGIKLFEKGYCTAADGSTKSDFCTSEEFVFEIGLVQENCDALCVGNKFKCENGCFDGACLPDPSCDFTDTDGGLESNLKGTCTGSDGLDYVDTCENNNLIEYFPATGCDTACGGIGINCEKGCLDGACLPDPDKECREFCEGIAQKEPYVDGICVDRHGNTAEITCNVEGYTYETPIPRKCGTVDACCCSTGLTVE